MNGSTASEASQDRHKQGRDCPFCMLTEAWECARKRHGSFFHHLGNAEMELLKAFRSLIDWRISSIESRSQEGDERHRATRIEVE